LPARQTASSRAGSVWKRRRKAGACSPRRASRAMRHRHKPSPVMHMVNIAQGEPHGNAAEHCGRDLPDLGSLGRWWGPSGTDVDYQSGGSRFSRPIAFPSCDVWPATCGRRGRCRASGAGCPQDPSPDIRTRARRRRLAQSLTPPSVGSAAAAGQVAINAPGRSIVLSVSRMVRRPHAFELIVAHAGREFGR
jgi:hypothetical protein